MIEAPLSAARGLAPAAALAEQGFLAAGQSLESAVGILDRLTRRFADYIAELTGEALAETRRDLAAAGSHVAALAESHRSDAAALAELGEIAAAAGHRVAALQPIPQEVETLSLSARVVAGGMGFAAADFAVFAGNIRDAAVLARACLDQAGAALGQVDQDLTAARVEAAAFAQRHGPAMLAIPARLAGEPAQPRDPAAARRRSRDRGASAVGSGASAGGGTDLRTATGRHHPPAAGARADRQRDSGGAAGQVGDLLAAQLNDAADELAREGERIETGLRQLAQAAHAIGQLGLRVHGATRDGGFVAALEADIRETAALFTELSLGDAATDRRMAAVLDAAGALTQRLASMQSVQEDIRILGLNATLKCGRLGTLGRPLAAVAQELRLCSAAVRRERGECAARPRPARSDRGTAARSVAARQARGTRAGDGRIAGASAAPGPARARAWPRPCRSSRATPTRSSGWSRPPSRNSPSAMPWPRRCARRPREFASWTAPGACGARDSGSHRRRLHHGAGTRDPRPLCAAAAGGDARRSLPNPVLIRSAADQNDSDLGARRTRRQFPHHDPPERGVELQEQAALAAGTARQHRDAVPTQLFQCDADILRANRVGVRAERQDGRAAEQLRAQVAPAGSPGAPIAASSRLNAISP